MTCLSDIRTSISALSFDEAQALIMQRRAARRIPHKVQRSATQERQRKDKELSFLSAEQRELFESLLATATE